MSPRLNAPVLSVDVAKMHKIDPRNVESLYGMWTVFSKCADSIEGGKRYENLSWRLWNRETFCCPPQPQLSITPAIDVPSRPSSKDVPELSASVDSVASVESNDPHKDDSTPTIPETQSSLELQDSALSRSRGHEKHLTPLALKKMVVNIQEQPELEPLSPSLTAQIPAIIDITPRPLSPPAQPSITVEEDSRVGSMHESMESCETLSTNNTTRQSDHRGSDTSVSSDGGLIRSGSVVHGFSPSQMSSSFRSRSKLNHVMPVPATRSSPAKFEKSKKNATFTLGGSSGEDESSFEDRMSFKQKRSSLSETLGRHLSQAKKPSFRDIVEAHQQEKIKEGSHESTDEDEAIASSDEEEDDDDDAIDSAIEEEDEGEWEDSNSDDGRAPVADKALFKRVDSRPNLVSRRSMLTTALHEPERAAALAGAASRSSPAIRRSGRQSPQGPSLPASPSEHDEESALTMTGPGRSRPRPIIMTTSNTGAPAHSPRTTRRNMLSTELTESLRKNLLWERQQKNTTANAVFKRRHTAQNMAGLKDFPAPTERHDLRDAAKNNSWNHYFDTPNEYHNKGW